MSVRIQLRRDTAANWTATNPTLTQGEPGYETDTGKIKYGDGTTAWSSLAYAPAAAVVDGTIVNADINASAAIADTKLATISTAGKVSNNATTATSANTASAIVARDASGNFSAGTITAALSGNASTAATLQTAWTINGTSFNGSANITTANWGTSRTLTVGNTGKAVDGSVAVSWSLAEIGAQAALGFTPIQQGGGTGQGSSKVYIGWLGSSLGLTVDTTNFGSSWPISVTGSAASATTATTLLTARSINGTSFNGSADITTSSWGSARNFTIGNTTKSVNGSSNVSFTLQEIGAAGGGGTSLGLVLALS